MPCLAFLSIAKKYYWGLEDQLIELMQTLVKRHVCGIAIRSDILFVWLWWKQGAGVMVGCTAAAVLWSASPQHRPVPIHGWSQQLFPNASHCTGIVIRAGTAYHFCITSLLNITVASDINPLAGSNYKWCCLSTLLNHNI